MCNGHADTCNYLDPLRPDQLVCHCQHNTVGDQCEMCDAANGFVQKKWQPRRVNSAFECERKILIKIYSKISINFRLFKGTIVI